MKKAIAVSVFIVLLFGLMVGLVACGQDDTGPVAVEVAPPTPAPTPEPVEVDLEPEPMEEAPAAQDHHPLVGEWFFYGYDEYPFYVFGAGGMGYMVEDEIRWLVRDHILAICFTPDACYDGCYYPAEWLFELEYDVLTLTSTLEPDISFEYNRR